MDWMDWAKRQGDEDMNATTPIAIAAVILTGCGNASLPGTAGSSPKEAAELCNAWNERVEPSPGQAQVVAAFEAGEISFNECLRKLRS